MEVERVTWMATLPLRRPLGVFCHVAPAGQPGGSVTGVWWEVLTDRECVVWGKALVRMIRNRPCNRMAPRPPVFRDLRNQARFRLGFGIAIAVRSEEHTSELQSPCNL